MLLMWVKALIKAMWGQRREMRVAIKCNIVYILQERPFWLQLCNIPELCLEVSTLRPEPKRRSKL